MAKPKRIKNVPEYKLVMVGEGGVGKSALTIQFFRQIFVSDYDPTIEDSYRQLKNVDGEPCVLDILDTAGQEQFTAMKEVYMGTGEGFLMVYSVTDKQSFNGIRDLYTQILRVKDTGSFPVLLVANKIDLNKKRVITEEEGKALATELNIPYIETSAKDPPFNVDAAYHKVVRAIKKSRSDTDASKKKSWKTICTLL